MILRNGIILFCLIFSVHAVCWSDYIKCHQQRAAVIKYLKTYDYITAEQLASCAREKYLKAALKRFQDLVGLEPTGVIDPETYAEVTKPRCGRSDLYSARKHNVVPWKNQVVTYSVLTNTKRFCHADLKRTMREVFNAWSDYIPRRFVEVNTEAAADVKVRFGRLTHGDTMDFDGPGGAYAHATDSGILHFDDDDLFKRYAPGAVITDYTLRDIFWVALHEVGHVLGVDHIRVGPSIMAPVYVTSRDANGKYLPPTLKSPEIARVQEIYGGKLLPKLETTTTIANGALHHAYAIAENDRDYIGNITADFFQVAEQSRWRMEEIPRDAPFTEIVAGSMKAFNPRAASNETVFVTIFTHDIATGNIMRIVDAHEVPVNTGVIIGADNQIKIALQDKIWVDENGIDHTRRKCCVFMDKEMRTLS